MLTDSNSQNTVAFRFLRWYTEEVMKKMLTIILILALLTIMSSCGSTVSPLSGENGTVVFGRDSRTSDADDLPEEGTDSLSSVVSDIDLSSVSEEAAYYMMLPVLLPESSDNFSTLLAIQSLLFCSGHTQSNTAAMLTNAGFTILAQEHFDKDDLSAEHTCAYTIAKKDVIYRGGTRTLLIAAIRGTNGGEWYSNFDFAPSGTDDAVFSENFLFAAEDVFLNLSKIAENEENPLFLICGHSRGAACANLLGVLINTVYGEENTFVYTFATPATYRGSDELPDCNIFNILNPCDIVPRLPLESWGFNRAGRDIILNGDETVIARLDSAISTLSNISPSISSYYNDRHSLTAPGLSDDGLTSFEVFLAVGNYLAGSTDQSFTSSITAINEESDYYPLLVLFDEAQYGSSDLLTQHLPTTYLQLISYLN